MPTLKYVSQKGLETIVQSAQFQGKCSRYITFDKPHGFQKALLVFNTAGRQQLFVKSVRTLRCKFNVVFSSNC